MKRKAVSLLVLATSLLTASAAIAEDLPDAPLPAAVSTATKSAQPKFWTRTEIALVSANAGMGAFDAVQTCQGLANGGHERWIPSQNCAVTTSMIVVGKVAITFLDYELYKHGHPKAGRWLEITGLAGSAAAVTYSKVNHF